MELEARWREAVRAEIGKLPAQELAEVVSPAELEKLRGENVRFERLTKLKPPALPGDT